MIAGSADLEQRRLGRSDVIVPRVAFGCTTVGGGEPAGFALLDDVADAVTMSLGAAELERVRTSGGA